MDKIGTKVTSCNRIADSKIVKILQDLKDQTLEIVRCAIEEALVAQRLVFALSNTKKAVRILFAIYAAVQKEIDLFEKTGDKAQLRGNLRGLFTNPASPLLQTIRDIQKDGLEEEELHATIGPLCSGSAERGLQLGTKLSGKEHHASPERN